MMTYAWVHDANILRFHAKEYPAYDKEVFPYNMGYCQVGKLIKAILWN